MRPFDPADIQHFPGDLAGRTLPNVDPRDPMSIPATTAERRARLLTGSRAVVCAGSAVAGAAPEGALPASELPEVNRVRRVRRCGS